MNASPLITDGFGSFGSIGLLMTSGLSSGAPTLTPVGAISPKIVQIENMLAASDTFRAAIGPGTTIEEAKERIHYAYAIIGEEGSDPGENLDKLANMLPFAVIMSHEQLAYAGVAFGGKHYLRAEGQMGLLLLFADTVEGQDMAACKRREILMSNFHGSVIDEIAQIAGEEERAPIDQISMDVPPTRTNPLTDSANDEDRGEVVPYYMVGYSIHWK